MNLTKRVAIILLSFCACCGTAAAVDKTAASLLPSLRYLSQIVAGENTEPLNAEKMYDLGYTSGLIRGVTILTQEMQRNGTLQKDLNIDLGSAGVRAVIVYRYLDEHQEELSEEDYLVVLKAFISAIRKKNGL